MKCEKENIFTFLRIFLVPKVLNRKTTLAPAATARGKNTSNQSQPSSENLGCKLNKKTRKKTKDKKKKKETSKCTFVHIYDTLRNFTNDAKRFRCATYNHG